MCCLLGSDSILMTSNDVIIKHLYFLIPLYYYTTKKWDIRCQRHNSFKTIANRPPERALNSKGKQLDTFQLVSHRNFVRGGLCVLVCVTCQLFSKVVSYGGWATPLGGTSKALIWRPACCCWSRALCLENWILSLFFYEGKGRAAVLRLKTAQVFLFLCVCVCVCIGAILSF